MLFKIAWRNVLRHGKRTLLTILTMTFGLGLFICIDSVLKGMDRMGLENIVKLTDSSVRISTKAYETERRSSPLDYGIQDVDALERELLEDERVLAVSARTRFIGQLSNGIDGVPIMAVAVDPEKDVRVFSLSEQVLGSWFGLGGTDAENGEAPAVEGASLVLGAKLAAELGVGLGDWITLSARTRYDVHNADDFQIIGLIDSTEPTINFNGVYIDFKDAQEFLDLEGLRTELTVRMADRINLKDAMADSDELAASISAAHPDLLAKSFGEVGRQFLEIAKVKSKGTGVIILVVLVIAGVGIANTVLMSVYSRIREIGVLRAFGLKPKQISRLFLIEGAIIGFLGSVAGVLFGVFLDMLAIYIGFPVDAFLGDVNMGIPIWGTLYGEWNPSQMVTAFIFGLAISLFSARFPAKKASRLEVTHALRFV